jgi:hypothetical protein
MRNAQAICGPPKVCLRTTTVVEHISQYLPGFEHTAWYIACWYYTAREWRVLRSINLLAPLVSARTNNNQHNFTSIITLQRRILCIS